MRRRKVWGGLLAGAVLWTAATPGLAMQPRDDHGARVGRREVPRALSNRHAVPLGKNVRPLSSAIGEETYSDVIGDSGGAFDVETVMVSDDASTFEFVVSIPNLQTIRPEDRLFTILDTDANPNTGTLNQAGAEFFIDIDGDGFDSNGDGIGDSPGIGLQRWNGFNWEAIPSGAAGSPGVGTLVFSVPRSDLGGTSVFNFYVHSVFPDGGVTFDQDLAPDTLQPVTATWRYPDDAAPVVEALKSTPRSPAVNRLSYQVTDDSGYSSWVLDIIRQGRSNPTRSIPFDYQPTNSEDQEFLEDWNVPKNVKGYHRFCLRATDGAGNTSGLSCKAVVFRRIRTDVELTGTQKVGPQYTNITFTLKNLPKGTRVTIDCMKGCGFKERATTSGTFRKVFKGKSLHEDQNAVVVVRATKARYVGHYEKIVFGHSLKRSTKCLAPGLRKPAKCP